VTEYKTTHYPKMKDMEDHLNELSKKTDPRRGTSEWQLHSFAIDPRDGSVHAVLTR
jgi:hypothetical protein